MTPTNTAWATGGSAHPSGTVVTADGNVVVVVEDVVEVEDVEDEGTAGTVVDDSSGAAFATAGSAQAPAAMTNEKSTRRIDDTLPMGDTGPMGFNPTRKRVARSTDVWFVAAAIAVSLALVAWAFLG